MLDELTTSRALRRLRELASLSDRAAARMIGVSRQTLRAWENHESIPAPEQLARAVEVYGYDVRALIVPRESIIRPEDPDVLVVGSRRIDIKKLRRENPARNEFNHKVLVAYVDAVRAERSGETEPVALRAVDLQALATVLDLSDSHLDRLLGEVFDLTPAGSRSTTRAVLAAALLSVSVIGTIGGPWFAPAAMARTAEPTTSMFSTSPHLSIETAFVDSLTTQESATQDGSDVFSITPRTYMSDEVQKALPAGSTQNSGVSAE